MVQLYTRPGCSKCSILKLKLQQAGINFSQIDNEETLIKIGLENNISSAPILQVDANFYDFSRALEYIKRVG